MDFRGREAAAALHQKFLNEYFSKCIIFNIVNTIPTDPAHHPLRLSSSYEIKEVTSVSTTPPPQTARYIIYSDTLVPSPCSDPLTSALPPQPTRYIIYSGSPVLSPSMYCPP